MGLLGKVLLLIVIGVGAGMPAWAESPAPLPVDLHIAQDSSSYRISGVRYLVTGPEVSLAQVMSSAAADEWPLYGNSVGRQLTLDQVLWVTFTVVADQTLDEDWWLRIRLGALQSVTVHTYNTITQDLWQSRAVGMLHPVENRYKPSRHLAFPLALPEQQPVQVFMAIQAPNLVALPLEIVSEKHFGEDSNLELLVLSMVLGAMAVMSLYNLMLYLVLRDRPYLFYCTYVGYALLFLAGATGIGPYYLWPGQPWLLEHGTLTFACLAFLSATLFVRTFLELHRYSPLLLHTNTVLQGIWAMLAVIFMFANTPELFAVLAVMSIGTSLIGLGTALYIALKRSIPAMIFSVAWSALFLGTLIFSLMLAGVLPFNFYTAYAQIFGMVVELVLLSFALAYRIRLDQASREQAQAESLNMAVRVIKERTQRLDAQKQMLELQQNLNEQLETQVAQRTRQYEEAMDKLEDANSNLLRLSMTDPLSKVSNRRSFDEIVVKECRRAYRTQQPMAVILLDIDHFKAINDTYGHGVGDHCIRQVAQALDRVVSRAGDLLARYGGEEFVYVLPATTETQALAVAERSRELVEALSISREGIGLSLTISAGVAAWVPAAEEDYTDLIATADKALYRAKAAGRNRVKALSRKTCDGIGAPQGLAAQ